MNKSYLLSAIAVSLGLAFPLCAQADTFMFEKTVTGPGVSEYSYTKTTEIRSSSSDVVVERPVLMEKTIESPIVVEKPVFVDRTIETPVFRDRIVEKPVYIEKTVEKPVYIEKTVEKPVYVEKTVEKPVFIEKPVIERPVVIKNGGSHHLLRFSLF